MKIDTPERGYIFPTKCSPLSSGLLGVIFLELDISNSQAKIRYMFMLYFATMEFILYAYLSPSREIGDVLLSYQKPYTPLKLMLKTCWKLDFIPISLQDQDAKILE
ncbi:unnamed protein product [Allacma fusca]|uniref:Uncharacterized protein n=1 Tax=Allacma fusca TaxID=39272 RepID=A0A8J2LXE0_9HEXA|nr:unnamed protein product [Allacma fusca]